MPPTRQLDAVDRIPWSSGSPRRRRPGHAPRPWVADACLALAGLGLGITLALVVSAESRSSLAAPGGLLLAGGRLAGFVGTYLILVMVVLIARLPWLERAVGQDRLVRWHRRLGPWALWLITAHVVLITLGYARMSHTGFLRQLWVFLTTYPDLLAAVVGFGLLVMAGITSIRIARQPDALRDVVGRPPLLLPGPRPRLRPPGGDRCRLRRPPAGPGLLDRGLGGDGRHGPRLPGPAPGGAQPPPPAEGRGRPRGGARCLLRHLHRVGTCPTWPCPAGSSSSGASSPRACWWHAHPYSLSALPQAPYLRVTVKGLGDQSRAVAHLRPGTRVFVEGPYGAFTHHVRATDRVVLIGAGVGITPLRALLEDLPAGVDATVIIRASAAEEIVHRDEVAELVERHGAAGTTRWSGPGTRCSSTSGRSAAPVPRPRLQRRVRVRSRRVQRPGGRVVRPRRRPR